jgi:peptidoglycan/LPS O-acetylase OafA/YrhL
VKLWFPEVDILKATAILLIVFSHLDNYVSIYAIIRLFDWYAAFIGLSIFFFVSGFLLSQTDPVINSIKDIKKFYIKKFIRIFPIYWVALASLVIFYGVLKINQLNEIPYHFSLNNLLIHFFGLQGILPNNNIESPVWFVGVILIFYFLYPIIVFVSKNSFKTFTVSSIILISLVILHFFFGWIDINTLTYFPIFISGLYINQIVYSSKNNVDEFLLKRILIINVILLFLIFLIFAFRKFYNADLQFFHPILLICAMISLCIFYLIFAHLFIKIRGKIMIIISSIAFGTYAIFLFENQFMTIFSLMIIFIFQNVILQDIIILTLGFTGSILCGITIQKVEQYIVNSFKKNPYITLKKP